MRYISSDTNIWLDFNSISQIGLPFRFDCTYVMFNEALRKEIIEPESLLYDLVRLGLKGVELTTEEFFYADKLGQQYPKLSAYDRTALVIAKCRKYPLLTGDHALRSAAGKESVPVFGTIGLLDKLYEEGSIDKNEYASCLKGLLQHKERGLPADELNKRLENLKGGDVI